MGNTATFLPKTTSNLSLFPYQSEAIEKLNSGSILSASVGSGKSITALAYYFIKECNGSLGADGKLSAPKAPKDLYIITTARKRDTFEWEEECLRFGLSSDPKKSGYGISVTIDSWNNVHKYCDVEGSFFLFDEQRVVGSGVWVKSFIKIARVNRWLLLSATPGDTWMDYVPVFIANGFFKNRTDFSRRHAIYSRFSKFPKIDRYVDIGHLEALRRRITVTMNYKKPTTPHFISLSVEYDRAKIKTIMVSKWNPFDNVPIRDVAEACYLMRKIVNTDSSRIQVVRDLMKTHPRMIIFYNYDAELELLRTLSEECPTAEWNGHNHEPIPSSESWLYLVQYMAGAEGWNCIETDVIVFYSQNYSYKLMTQAAGRIDRLNTPYSDLYYYTLKSSAPIDLSIDRALKSKRNFNEASFMKHSKFA
jgi:hypothetical protein